MAYFGGFKVDAYISYPMEAEAWAKQFEKVLKELLGRKLSRIETYLPNTDWHAGDRSEEMLEHARHAALFLAIVTRASLQGYDSSGRFQFREAKAFRELRPVGDRFIPIPLDFIRGEYISRLMPGEYSDQFVNKFAFFFEDDVGRNITLEEGVEPTRGEFRKRVAALAADLAVKLRKIATGQWELAHSLPVSVQQDETMEAPPALVPTPTSPQQFPRSSSEYWLYRVDVERKLTFGDQPLVLISFAGDDQKWVNHLRDFLDAKMELLRDKNGQPYHLWNYSDAKHGTRVGDEFPEIVAEKMWRCQAAILLFSRAYFRSDYCKQIELPFLLWRRDHHNLMCLPIKIGTATYDKVRIPSYQCDSRYVILNELVDDRQAAEKFIESQYRSWDLGRLRQEGKDWDIDQRLAGVAQHIAEFLKANCSAVEVG